MEFEKLQEIIAEVLNVDSPFFIFFLKSPGGDHNGYHLCG